MANSNSPFFEGGVIGAGPDDLLGDDEYSSPSETNPGNEARMPGDDSADSLQEAAENENVESAESGKDPSEILDDVFSGLHDSSHKKNGGDGESLGLDGPGGAQNGDKEQIEADAPITDLNSAVGAPAMSNFDPMGLLQPIMQLSQLFGSGQMPLDPSKLMQPMQQMMGQLPQQMGQLMGQSQQGWQGAASDSAMGNMQAHSDTLSKNTEMLESIGKDLTDMQQTSAEKTARIQKNMQGAQEGNKQAVEGAQNMQPAQMVQGMSTVNENTAEAAGHAAEMEATTADKAASVTGKAVPSQPPDISKLLGPLQSMMQMPMQLLQQAPQMLQGLTQMPQQMMQQGSQMLQGLGEMAGKAAEAGAPSALDLPTDVDALKDGGKLAGNIDAMANIGGMGGATGLAGLGGGGIGGGSERTLSAAPGTPSVGGSGSGGTGAGGVSTASSASGASLSTRPAGMGGSGGGMGMMPAQHGAGESKSGSKVPDYLKGSVMGNSNLGDIPQVSPSVLGTPQEGEGESARG